jgi:ankyrin repeat protein
MEAIRALTASELRSAERGQRPTRGGVMDLVAGLALRDWSTAERLVRDNPELLRSGALHYATKRHDVTAVKWLLAQGADLNARWTHWDAEVTPLHLAAWAGDLEIARLLVEAGADSTIKDSRHDSDALGWAEFFQRDDIVRLLRERPATRTPE